MRFLIGLLIGVALTVGAAAYHDNNVPTPPRSIADRPIVDWDAAGAAMRDSTSFVGRWWDSLMGKTTAPQPPR